MFSVQAQLQLSEKNVLEDKNSVCKKHNKGEPKISCLYHAGMYGVFREYIEGNVLVSRENPTTKPINSNDRELQI